MHALITQSVVNLYQVCNYTYPISSNRDSITIEAGYKTAHASCFLKSVPQQTTFDQSDIPNPFIGLQIVHRCSPIRSLEAGKEKAMEKNQEKSTALKAALERMTG